MRNRKKILRRALQNNIRDAAAGINRDERTQVQRESLPTHLKKRRTAHRSPGSWRKLRGGSRTPDPRDPNLVFANPEILGDSPEPEFHNEDGDNPRIDPRYRGSCEMFHEDTDCVDPDTIKDMELEERALWLGKWFAHHYGAWVSEFDMKELENYDWNEGILHDQVVSPVAMVYWTVRHFRVPENEWRSPQFSSPFLLGLRRFRNEVVSTLRTHAIRIFDITDIKTIDDREASDQVTTLHENYQFLYAPGDSNSMERYLRSDCMALRVVLLGPAALEGHENQKSPEVRAALYRVKTIRDTLVAFVAAVLYFLLIDGKTFRSVGSENEYKKFYQEQLKALTEMDTRLPKTYKSYKEFININVLGEEEGKAGDTDGKEPTEFAKKFYADMDKAIAEQKKELAREEEEAGDEAGENEEQG